MPSLRKLAIHAGATLLPKVGKDLTVFATPLVSSISNMGPLSDEFSSSSLDLSPHSSILDIAGLNFSISEDNEDDYSEDSPSPQPHTRKRQRLDHLSQEEKVMRRKLKNRVAAQSARDRKKAKMTELEEHVLQLKTQNKYLALENNELKKKNKTLERDNSRLKLRLCVAPEGEEESEAGSLRGELPASELLPRVSLAERMEEEDEEDEEDEDEEEEEERKEERKQEQGEAAGSVEYASLICGPLPKEQDLRLLTLWMMRFVYLPAAARLMTFLICFNAAATTYSSMISTVPISKARNKGESLNLPRGIKWWGPHQNAWNPSKN